ncbi:MAG: DUF5130 family protein [Sporichthyaceae bacterium]
MGPVLAGEAFSERQRGEIIRAIQLGQRASGVQFSVYVGAAEGPPRPYAMRRHAELGASAPDSVLVFVDPAARNLEIVSGARARRWVNDRAAGLAAATMTSAFAAGNLAGGIASGINVLAEHARHPQSLHTG